MSKTQEIILTAWSNSSSDKPNGFRIEKDDRDRLLLELKRRLSKEGVIIELPSGESPRLFPGETSRFWSTCPEFRSHKIGKWIKERREDSWRKRESPKYIAHLLTTGTGPIKIKVLRKL